MKHLVAGLGDGRNLCSVICRSQVGLVYRMNKVMRIVYILGYIIIRLGEGNLDVI
jgi:hypothetical protein